MSIRQHIHGLSGTGFPVLAVACVLPFASAAGTFSPPKGCKVYVTVQLRSCVVANYFRCSFDNEGEQRYVEFDQDGLSSYGKVDAEYQWLETWNYLLEEMDYAQLPAADSASFSGLMETGSDTYDFTMVSKSGVEIRYTGGDRLTGRQVEIDGVTLHESTFDMNERYTDGSSDWHGQGQDYIQPDWRIFLAGKGEWVSAEGETEPYDYTPVAFAFPGERGFLTTDPLYDCRAQMAGYRPRTHEVGQ